MPHRTTCLLHSRFSLLHQGTSLSSGRKYPFQRFFKIDLPGSLQKEHSAARCRNCARINVCCFKPPSLWSLVQHLRKLTRCPSFSPPWSSPSFPDSVADTTTQCQARPRGRVGLASQHPILIHPALCILLTQFQSLRSPLHERLSPPLLQKRLLERLSNLLRVLSSTKWQSREETPHATEHKAEGSRYPVS